MKLTPKKDLLEAAQAVDSKNLSEEEEALRTLQRCLKNGVDFGEAIFTISFGGLKEALVHKLNEELTRNGYDYTFDYEEFTEGYGGEGWSRVEYHIPLGERKPRLCDGCGEELKNLAFEQSHYQFDNALWLGFHGGYGMFLDDLGMPTRKNRQLKSASTEAVLCHDCAHKLFDTFPNFKNVVFDPAGGHTHTEEYRKTYPNHYGWDYEDDDGEVEQLELFKD